MTIPDSLDGNKEHDIIVRETFVIDPGNSVNLDCNQATNDTDAGVGLKWSKLGQDNRVVTLNTSETTLRVTVNMAEDQAKFICHRAEDAKVYAVHYVSIKGTHPSTSIPAM